jgi:hypothetical protein
MGKPVNIASTSHAQQAEMAVLLGGRGTPAPVGNDELAAENAELKAMNADLEAALAAEREAHEKTQAALAAATSAPVGE